MTWGSADSRADGSDDYIDLTEEGRKHQAASQAIWDSIAKAKVRQANIETYGEQCLKILDKPNGHGEVFGGLYIERRIVESGN